MYVVAIACQDHNIIVIIGGAITRAHCPDAYIQLAHTHTHVHTLLQSNIPYNIPPTHTHTHTYTLYHMNIYTPYTHCHTHCTFLIRYAKLSAANFLMCARCWEPRRSAYTLEQDIEKTHTARANSF